MKTILCLLLLAVAGCGAAHRETEELGESVRQYNDGVRWQRFSVAANFVPPAERSRFADEMDERGTDLKITDYEVVKVDPHGPKEARVQVKLSWYKDSEGTVRETHALQTWELHGKAWLMVDEARLRGAAMPGLPETTMKD